MRHIPHKALFAFLLVKINFSSSQKYDEIQILDNFDYGKDTVLKLTIDYEIDSSGNEKQDAKWASSELKQLYRRGNFLKVNFIFNTVDGKTIQSEDSNVDNGMVDVDFVDGKCLVSNFGKKNHLSDQPLEVYLTILAKHYNHVVESEVTEQATDDDLTTDDPSDADDDEASTCCECETDCSCCNDLFWLSTKKNKCLATECSEDQAFDLFEISE